jgi:hypothetical protein
MGRKIPDDMPLTTAQLKGRYTVLVRHYGAGSPVVTLAEREYRAGKLRDAIAKALAVEPRFTVAQLDALMAQLREARAVAPTGTDLERRAS